MSQNRHEFNYASLREQFGKEIADEFRAQYGSSPKMRVKLTNRQIEALPSAKTESERNALIAQIVHWNRNP